MLNDSFDLIFYDTNASLIDSLNSSSGYTTYISRNNQLHSLRVSGDFLSPASSSQFNASSIKLAFICVGPRNVEGLPSLVSNLECPIYVLENDPQTIDRIKSKFGKSNVYFGVPDVITSSQSSPENKLIDVHSLHTEDGTLYLESCSESPSFDLPKTFFISTLELEAEWHSKLYLHNTAHCIAAYLGFQNGCTYLHESYGYSFHTLHCEFLA